MNPRVVIEVSSPSTDEYDHGEKLEHYKQMPSLAAVVIVASRTRQIEIWSRSDGALWQRTQHGPGTIARIDAVSATFAVNELYDVAGI